MKTVKIYSRGVKIAGAFSKEKALATAKRLAGKHAHFAQRGDELGYAGGYPEWIYIKLSEVL